MLPHDPAFTDILTLAFDPESQAHFEHMRQLHYPAELNRIGAHLTLFHTLPESEEVRTPLLEHAARSPFTMRVTGLRSLGRGVAYTLESPELLSLHRSLSAAFAEHLSPQDKQKFQPHVVIQNKASGDEARTLRALLTAGFRTFEVQAVGLELWRYLRGPWQLRERLLFNGGGQDHRPEAGAPS